jgi:hypothetical protein
MAACLVLKDRCASLLARMLTYADVC